MSAPTDADVEHLRRAMVEAWQTWRAMCTFSSRDLGDEQDGGAAGDDYLAAARAYVAAKRARGGL